MVKFEPEEGAAAREAIAAKRTATTATATATATTTTATATAKRREERRWNQQ